MLNDEIKKISETFLTACKEGNFEYIKQIIKHENFEIDISNSFSHNNVCKILFKEQHWDILQYLNFSNDLKNKIKPSLALLEEFKLKVLSACIDGEEDIVKGLVPILANSNINMTVFARSCIFKACRAGSIPLVEYFLTSSDFKPNITIHVDDGSLLLEACAGNDLEMVRFLLTSDKLKKHININMKQGQALITACNKDHLNIVKYLTTSNELKEHIDINVKNGYGFKEACLNKSLNVINYYLFEQNIPITKEFKKWLKHMEGFNPEIVYEINKLILYRDLINQETKQKTSKKVKI